MKKLLFVLALANCVMPFAHGHQPIIHAFSPEWTPLQIQMFVPPLCIPVALFNPESTVYGIDLTLLGYQGETYGFSCGVVSIHGGHCGIGIALANGVEDNTGLMCGVINVIQRNRGVALGIVNGCETDPAVWIPKSENFLQIGLFNYAQNGLQIGVLNYNPNALIPWMVFFNYSPGGESAPAADDRRKGEHDPGKQNKDQRK